MAPQYPKQLAMKGVQGCVVVTFQIRADGRGDLYRIIDSQPAGVFDAVALQALAQWKFDPMQPAGRYAESINFEVEGVKPQAFKACVETPKYEELNERHEQQ
ncbi:energy transducer TonB [Hydrocarboniphaga sp.]|uniref:energy transducer TonB n=1 Tax=Hydrocarboniphaga sp. TaxID=2033016 RepID=UPI003D10DD3C